VLPAIAPLLSRTLPWLHISFHPFNLLVEDDPYRTELHRLRGMLDAAEALSCYQYMHVFSHGVWETLADADGRAEARFMSAIGRAPEGGSLLLDTILADVWHELDGRVQADDLTLLTATLVQS